MKELFFKCTLKSDVVLNSSLATVGNMSSLDYIPGSNFLGIVASKLYNKLSLEKAFELFHSNKVKFGDATIYDDYNGISYPIPFSFFLEKNDSNKNLHFYLHHKIDSNYQDKDEKDFKQLKQQRNGYLYKDGTIQKTINKSFSLKSAQDRKTRTSKEGQMYGFESLSKGQTFVFSIQFDDESLIDIVRENIEGEKKIGKSKTAEFGQVKIENIENISNPMCFNSTDEYTLVYAESNLCFLDNNGFPTYKPEAKDFGFNSGEIIWEKSQIRTYEYSPWNFKRNTSSTERNCIAKGSVFYVKGIISKNKDTVGLYQNEGLGRVIFNPFFLEEGEIAKTKIQFQFKDVFKLDVSEKNDGNIKTELGKFLSKKLESNKKEMEISKKVQHLVYSPSVSVKELIKISPSQWGGVRAYASKASNYDELRKSLFDKDKGYLTHGVADIKYWGRNKGANLKAFKLIFEENAEFGPPFIEKFAAEIAKINKRK